jgi:thiamine monophosphate kinase
MTRLAPELQLDPLELAAAAGEDYELCVCLEPSASASAESALAAAGGEGITWIGRVVEGEPGVALIDASGNERPLEGYEHRW